NTSSAKMAPTQEKHSSEELLQAQVDLWHHALGFVKSMALKCAMELQIPNTIQHHDIFVVHEVASPNKEVAYGLTPTTRLLAIDEVRSNLSPILSLILDSTVTAPFSGMHSWFLDEHSTSLFEKAHGLNVWEMAAQNSTYNQLINDAMVSDSNFLMDIILRECSGVFLGIKSLIDVAGGHGGSAKAIAKAFPQMKCSVLDLPHVVEEAPTFDHVSFISGDMFKYIPPA
uniref:O-methyltransferase C-terminal domain-containing protein n=1 Tax=Aegilops tauschii subsp. strangulata TaxID=200361 RepID=A0A452ZJQ4_AEGTS